MPDLGLEAFRANFGEAASYMKFGGGLGIKMEEDGSGERTIISGEEPLTPFLD